MSDLDIDLSGPLKVKSDEAVGLAIYASYCCSISNIWPNSATFRDISLHYLSNLVFDLRGYSRSKYWSRWPPYMTSYYWLKVITCLSLTV